MNADALLRILIDTTLSTSAATVLLLLLRKPLRQWFGASIAYAAWWLLPVAWLAVLLPAPTVQVARMMPLAVRVGESHALPALPVAAPLPWTLFVVCAWGLGAVAMLALFWLQQWRFQRALQAGELREGMQVANAVAGLPAVMGVLRPRIVLPADFAQRYDADERELILCHERVHVRRLDLQVNALVAALRALYWFNPLLHAAAARFHRDQELACDARVVAQHPQRRRAYADAMLKTQLAASSLPLGCHWQAYQPLKERIEMLNHHGRHPRRTSAGVLIVSLLTLGFGFAAWAAQPAKAAKPARVDVQSKNTNPPAYPVDAVQKGIGGTVVLLVDVAADGSVSKLTIDKSEPQQGASQDEFDAAVLEAAKKWRFVPAQENGKPVAGRVRVPVCFTTDESAKDACSSSTQAMENASSTTLAAASIAMQPAAPAGKQMFFADNAEIHTTGDVPVENIDVANSPYSHKTAAPEGAKDAEKFDWYELDWSALKEKDANKESYGFQCDVLAGTGTDGTPPEFCGIKRKANG